MILVVDDEENTRRSLTDILRLEGYQVNSAATSAQAIKMLDEANQQATPYDVILLDLRMPADEGLPADEQSGLNVLHHATEQAPDTQVIFLTAHGSLSTAIEALRNSALDYLLKPASLDQILVSVSKALERRQSILNQRSVQNVTSATLASTSNIAANMATAMSSALIQLENSIQALQAIQPPGSVLPAGAHVGAPDSSRETIADARRSEVRGSETLNALQTAYGAAGKDRRAGASSGQSKAEEVFDLGQGLVINFVRREIWQSSIQETPVDSGDLQAESSPQGRREQAGESSETAGQRTPRRGAGSPPAVSDGSVPAGSVLPVGAPGSVQPKKLTRREAAKLGAGRPGGTRVILTPTEGKLMQVFIENAGRVFSHRELVTLVQGYETTDWEAPEVLRPLISRLRRKLGSFPNGHKWIRSIRGTGYMFEIEES